MCTPLGELSSASKLLPRGSKLQVEEEFVWCPVIQKRNETSSVFGDQAEAGLAWNILREKCIFVDLKPYCFLEPS